MMKKEVSVKSSSSTWTAFSDWMLIFSIVTWDGILLDSWTKSARAESTCVASAANFDETPSSSALSPAAALFDLICAFCYNC